MENLLLSNYEVIIICILAVLLMLFAGNGDQK